MTPRKPPVVGQRLYSLNVGNSARHIRQELTPCVVTSVGRKYFTIWNNVRFHLDTWREVSEYSATRVLYESPQEWEDERESRRLWSICRERFAGYGQPDISLDVLRQVTRLISPESMFKKEDK